MTDSPERITAGEPLKVTVQESNTSDRDGDEIVQLYIRDMVRTVTRPLQELKDFERVHIKKGETKTISFIVTPYKLQYHGPGMKRIIEPGEFEISVGCVVQCNRRNGESTENRMAVISPNRR